jgi:hypothetical protein
MDKIIEHIVKGYLINEARHVYGGNSGYVGYSLSVRAAQAKQDGKYPKTEFRKMYGITPLLFQFFIDNDIVYVSEWHHTSMYGNKTNFYSWSNKSYKDCYLDNIDEIKKLFRLKKFEVILTIFEDSETIAKRKQEELETRQNELYSQYQNYIQKAREIHPIPNTYTTTNGVLIKVNDVDYSTIINSIDRQHIPVTAYKNGEKLTKRHGKKTRDFAFEEFRNYINQNILTFPEWKKQYNK